MPLSPRGLACGPVMYYLKTIALLLDSCVSHIAPQYSIVEGTREIHASSRRPPPPSSPPNPPQPPPPPPNPPHPHPPPSPPSPPTPPLPPQPTPPPPPPPNPPPPPPPPPPKIATEKCQVLVGFRCGPERYETSWKFGVIKVDFDRAGSMPESYDAWNRKVLAEVSSIWSTCNNLHGIWSGPEALTWINTL